MFNAPWSRPGQGGINGHVVPADPAAAPVLRIGFSGAVAFEVLVLESLHRQFEHDIMARIEAAVMARARRFMPFVVALLFLSGFALFDIRCDGFACIGSRFGWLLSAKVALAFGVLAVFVTAVRAAMRGAIDR